MIQLAGHLRQHLRMHKKSASKREEHKTDIGSLGTMTKLHILKDKTIEDFKYLLKPKEVEPKCNLLLECSYCNQILPSKGEYRKSLPSGNDFYWFSFHRSVASTAFSGTLSEFEVSAEETDKSYLRTQMPILLDETLQPKCVNAKLSQTRYVLVWRLILTLFFWTDILARHLRGHFERSMCPLCDRRFKNRIDLQLHASREHGAIECSPQFSCHICGKQFHRNEHLTKHIRTHINDRPFECDLCRKTFGRKDKLKLHMNWHNGVKPHQCPHCDRSFSQKVHMTNHTRIHVRYYSIK